MDTRNFTWINTFNPNEVDQTPLSPSSPSNSQPLSNNDNKTVIMLASLFGVSGSVIILVCGFFIYRRSKKRRQEDLPGFPGTTVLSGLGTE